MWSHAISCLAVYEVGYKKSASMCFLSVVCLLFRAASYIYSVTCVSDRMCRIVGCHVVRSVEAAVGHCATLSGCAERRCGRQSESLVWLLGG